MSGLSEQLKLKNGTRSYFVNDICDNVKRQVEATRLVNVDSDRFMTSDKHDPPVVILFSYIKVMHQFFYFGSRFISYELIRKKFVLKAYAKHTNNSEKHHKFCHMIS